MAKIPEGDHPDIPRHIAIIMDGNGRWAQQRGMPRIMGHKAGVKSVQEVVRAAREIGVQILTLYAFSTENWQRPAVEIQALMGLLKSYLESELATMVENDVRLRCSGQIEKIPSEVRKVLARVIERTAGNDGLILNLALSYGGRSEIVRAAQALARQCLDGSLDPDAITEELFASALYSAGLPDPDLLVRTGGESRLSNFLLWQASYSELYFTQILWPDFRRTEFLRAITDYRQRQRRFGRIGGQADKKT